MSELYEKIYAVIRKIPCGKVATYGQIARLAGMGPHARLVGYALHALTPDNKVPWHRVVGAGGKISLGGEGNAIQRILSVNPSDAETPRREVAKKFVFCASASLRPCVFRLLSILNNSLIPDDFL
jgi:alkylated DNA nucleotide flippase Atl1